MLILCNLLGIVAGLMGIAMFKQSDRGKICLWGVLMSVTYIIAFLCIGAYSGVITSVGSLAQNILVWKKKYTIPLAILILAIVFAVSIYNFKSWLDFLAPVGNIFTTMGYFILQKGKIGSRRVLAITASVFWLNYYISVLNIMSAVFEVIYLVISFTKVRGELKLQSRAGESV